MKPPFELWHKRLSIVTGRMSLAISLRKLSKTEVAEWISRLNSVQKEMTEWLSKLEKEQTE